MAQEEDPLLVMEIQAVGSTLLGLGGGCRRNPPSSRSTALLLFVLTRGNVTPLTVKHPALSHRGCSPGRGGLCDPILQGADRLFARPVDCAAGPWGKVSDSTHQSFLLPHPELAKTTSAQEAPGAAGPRPRKSFRGSDALPY